MSDYSGPERRKFSRIEASVITDYRILGEEEFQRGQLQNVSSEGVRFSGCKLFPVDEILELKLWLPTISSFITFQGHVVWSNSTESIDIFDTGIAIARIDPGQKAQLTEFVNTFGRENSV